ncbi:biotin synthase [Blyttiomyces sp. JEL0837]|nr:biotin synthase [Blyttiomyces sp. JEL0837]
MMMSKSVRAALRMRTISSVSSAASTSALSACTTSSATIISTSINNISRRSITSSTPTSFARVDESHAHAAASAAPPSFVNAPHFPRQGSPASEASVEAAQGVLRHNWTKQEIEAIYNSPLMDLLFNAAWVHRGNHDPLAVQQCTLLSIKTGGCSEDCAYCPQSSKYKTSVKAEKLMQVDAVLDAAKKAKEAGSSRFCMGAAWRDMNGRKTNFNQILHYVKEIRGMGMEVCCTLGMITEEQAKQLKEAGLTAYNHNLDTSREYYPKIITTRSYDERLETISHVRDAGIHVCSGGIIGLGETDSDRVGMLHTLANLPEHPESVPVNALLAVEGTPLEDQKPVEIWEMVRMIATARIVMPKSNIRLSAGRVRFSQAEQGLCFMAGANSIFTGDKLLTTPNNTFTDDQLMFKNLGLVPKAANFESQTVSPSACKKRQQQVETPLQKDEIKI